MKKKVIFVLLLVVVLSGFYIETEYGISSLIIEKVTGKTPEAKIESYIKAVSGGNKEQAFVVWDIPEINKSSADYYKEQKEQRETFTQDLIAKKISSNFKIKNIEWWSTCCEPHVIQNPRMAGRAKFYVELTDSNNIKSIYVFDLEVPDGYTGGLTGHHVRDWKITEAYPANGYSQEAQPIISGWKVYQSKRLGFRIDYPSDWGEKDSSPNYSMLINFIDPQTLKYIESSKKELEDRYGSVDSYLYDNSNISVIRYSSLKDIYGKDTIEDAIKNDSEIKKVGEIQIDGASAIETIISGESANYVIMFENKGYYYEIRLNNVSNKESISETQKQMISSFRFVN